jgi:hypothetical protein
MNLGVTVMASRNAVISSGSYDLVKFHLSILATCFSITGLQKPTTAAATIIVTPVGGHLNYILLPDNGFDNIAQIFRHRLTKAFADDLAWILNSKFNFQVLVPVGTDLQFSLPDPFGIVLIDARNFQVSLDSKFSQSFQDRKSYVTSLGIEIDLAPEIFGLLDGRTDNMFPGFIIGQEHTVVFSGPSLGAVSPVCSGNMKNLPQGDQFIRLRHRLS